MRILITGGAGFIGSNLASYLMRQGHEVNIIDDLSAGNIDNINSLRGRHIKFVKGDILRYRPLEKIISGSDLVFHLAALVGVKRTIENPIKTFEINASGSKRIFQYCCKYNVPVVFSSSSEVYGLNTEMPLTEQSLRIFSGHPDNRWIYALSKIVAEAYCLNYADQGLKYIILRYFNCYGPKMARGGYSSVVIKFFDSAINNTPLTVYGDGNQTRSFIYVEDLVKATYEAAIGKIWNKTFNIGTEDEIRIVELANKIIKKSNSTSVIEFTDPMKILGSHFTESKRRRPDTSKARSVFGFKPAVSLDEGLDITYSWLKEARKFKAA